MYIYMYIVYLLKLYYEVQVVEHLPTNFGDDHQETNPHVLRIGWSMDETSFQLGMWLGHYN